MSVRIMPDQDGFTGRECPDDACVGYFKIECGTGLEGDDVPCHCPYCGHTGSHDEFFTQEQIEYAKSVVTRKVTDAFYKDLKTLEFNHRPRGLFGIGLSMKVSPGRPVPIQHYREKQLETEVTCEQCTLRYAVYGVFAYCPDCGMHNSRQMLERNLDLAAKEIVISKDVDPEMAAHLTADAMKNVVSALDGFGRETCRVRADVAADPMNARNVSFQNLPKARKRLQDLFSIDLASAVTADEWGFACRLFQKRHLLAHKMGVVDQAYIEATDDADAVVGRKIAVSADEVTTLVNLARQLGGFLVDHLPLPTGSSG